MSTTTGADTAQEAHAGNWDALAMWLSAFVDDADNVAAAMRDSGWRPPARVIFGDVEAVTAALDGLPVGSIITCLDRDQSWYSDMLTYQRGTREDWFEVGVIRPRSSVHIARHQVPITVLREGDGS